MNEANPGVDPAPFPLSWAFPGRPYGLPLPLISGASDQRGRTDCQKFFFFIFRDGFEGVRLATDTSLYFMIACAL